MFLAGITLLGVAVSWGGTWLWNTASAWLPTTTAGILINVETVSGYAYVYIARQQWPPLGQLLGFALILAGVGLAVTRRPAPASSSIARRTANPSQSRQPDPRHGGLAASRSLERAAPLHSDGSSAPGRLICTRTAPGRTAR
jgi:hypothetical protein